MPKKSKAAAASVSSDDRWIFIAPIKDVSDQDDDHFVTLPHPKTGHGQQFVLRKNDTEVFEVVKFSDQPRSWFINNIVHQDGSLFVVTKFDPLFLILPFLMKSSAKFMMLDHILHDNDHRHIGKLSKCISQEDLSHLCDTKGEGDILACKLNEEKVTNWLKTKIELIKGCLEAININASGAHASTFVRSRKSRDCTPDDYLRYAHGLLSDYISDYWSQKVKGALGIQDEVLESSGEEPANKKPKLDDSVSSQPNEDYSKYFAKGKKSDQNANVKLTAAQKSLAKVNTKGMKSISSFFGAKAIKTEKST